MSIIFTLVAFLGCSAVLEIFRRKGLLDKSEALADFSEASARQAFPFARTHEQAWVGLGLSFLASTLAIAAATILNFSPPTAAIALTIQRSTTMHDIIIWLSILGGFSTLGTLGFRFRKEIGNAYNKTRKAIVKLMDFLGFDPKPESSPKKQRLIDEYLGKINSVKQMTTEVARLTQGSANSVEAIATDLFNHPGPEAVVKIRELTEIKSAFGQVSGEFVGQIEEVIDSHKEKMGFGNETRRSQPAVKTAVATEPRKEKVAITWAQGFNTIAEWFTGRKEGIHLNSTSRLYEPYTKYYAVRHNSLSDNSAIKSAGTWIEGDLNRFTANDFSSILIVEGQALEELIRTLNLVPGRDFAAFPVDGSGISEASFTNEGAKVLRLSDVQGFNRGASSAALPNLSMDIRNIGFAESNR
jgi:hypothetical protein